MFAFFRNNGPKKRPIFGENDPLPAKKEYRTGGSRPMQVRHPRSFADVEEIKKFLLKGVEAYPYAVNMPAPSVVLLDYEDSTLKLSLRAWGENEHYWDLYFDLRDMILRELRAHGIANPFPQLEVSLRERNAAPADPAAPAIQNLAGSAPARDPVTQEDAGKEV